MPITIDRFRASVPFFLLLAGACSGSPAPNGAELDATLAGLIAADRAFAAASADTTAAAGLAAMFSPDVALLSGGVATHGRDDVVAVLERTPLDAAGRLEWQPYRAGISADGRHGFSYGYMTLTRSDSSRVPLKYLAYWVAEPEGWRVRVYRRGLRPDAAVPDTMLPASRPLVAAAAQQDSALVQRFAAELAAAEQGFSDRAGVVGLRQAFLEHGAPDAMNMGGPGDTFVLGPEAISRAVSDGEPESGGSNLRWGADRVLVASSGDLGVTIGTIVVPAAAAGAEPRRIPFFTIWRRDSLSAPWRYVAE